MNRARPIKMQQQRGMALIVVLWLVVLLSVMAAGHSRNAHTDTKLASRQVESAKARALAEAGINHLILDMLAETPDEDLPVDGTVFTVSILGGTVALSIRNATGLVDLNAASPDILIAALKACGVAEAERHRLADTILDWRDRDDLAHVNGMEDDGYLAAGLPWTSRDGSFVAVDELKYLPGMHQSLYERLAPLVTVHSRHAGINLEYASPSLITALTGYDVPPASGASTTGARNGTFHIYSSASSGAGTIVSIEAVVNIARSSNVPFAILDWREPALVTLLAREGAES